jgi:DivIVA domain-containing protein
MSDFERTGATYEEPVKRRSAGTWFADIGDRLARGFNTIDRPPQAEPPEWESYDDMDQATMTEAVAVPELTRKRFPTALHGYDRDAVDEHIDGLEHELAQLLADRSPSAAVDAEIARVGEETSAILRVAHEQAAEIVRRAQAQADRCVTDAADNAVAITADANRKLRQLDSETDAVWAERVRLIDDVRSVATSLFSLAEDACDRFPEEAERGAAQPSPTVSASVLMPSPAPMSSPMRSSSPSPATSRSPSPPPAPSRPPAPVAAREVPVAEQETVDPVSEWSSEPEPE